MTAYRAYTLNPIGRITHAAWIEASSQEEAEAVATEMCGPGIPAVELWLGADRLAVVTCADIETRRPGG